MFPNSYLTCSEIHSIT